MTKYHLDIIGDPYFTNNLAQLAGDADRSRATKWLGDCHVTGHLDGDEMNRRIGLVLAAKTCGDLHAVTKDLPRHMAPPLAEVATMKGEITFGEWWKIPFEKLPQRERWALWSGFFAFGIPAGIVLFAIIVTIAMMAT